MRAAIFLKDWRLIFIFIKHIWQRMLSLFIPPALFLCFCVSHAHQNPVQQPLDYSASLVNPVFLERSVAVDADAPGRLKGPGVMEMLGGVAGAALCRTALSQAVRGQVRQLKSAVWAG